MSDEQGTEIRDEKAFGEWFEYGYSELGVYLKKVARFEKYCAGRDQKEQDEASPPQG